MAIRRRLLVAVLAVAIGLAGCATVSPPNELPAAATVAATVAAASSTTAAAATAPALATPVPAVDPVAFFRAQQAACARHAASTGNPGVDPGRFADATSVRDLGDGAYLVRDGQGTQLVVEPGKGIVLPQSGRAGDVMPQPYGFGCPETVFVGGADG